MATDDIFDVLNNVQMRESANGCGGKALSGIGQFQIKPIDRIRVVDRIDAITAIDRAHARTCDDQIVTRATRDGVGAGTGDKRIVSIAAH